MKSHWRFTNRVCLLGIFLLSSMAAQPQSNLEAWVRRYNSGEPGSRDYARKVAVDPDGNIVVAGDTDDGITGIDILIIKYSGAGVPLWTNRYNGPANADDRGYAMAVDHNRNVFVTGSSSDVRGKTDYATLAYSPAGVPLWTNHYNGPANSDDVPRALAVDHNGNAFVTGYSTGNGDYRDYATIAYSDAGVALWTNRYGPGGTYDGANAVAVDRSGNVFVTGSSRGDYATVAYSGTGVPLWANRYSEAEDSATAVAVDHAGNIFVTGSSYGIGTSYGSHYATIAYSRAGVSLWTNQHNGPGNSDDFAAALAVDHNGNVFVTGYSDDLASPGFNPDYATVAYSGSGVALWTNRYEGLGGGFDRPYALAVDNNGNILVTGSSDDDYATIKYSGAGVALWTNRYDGPANSDDDGANDVSVDNSGNVFVTGYSRADYATIAYSGAGVALWTNRYNGPVNTDDEASALAVDQSTGNVLVTGYSSIGANSDYVTIAYSEAGLALWTNRYNGPANREDGASSVAVDTTGNVVVTGGSYGEISFNYTTIAYSASGVALWTNRYGGPGNFYDYARSVAVDGSGNVFVTGYSYGSDYDYATIAYSSAGVALWTNRYNGPGNNSSDYAWAVTADKTGNVFVTGYSTDSDGQAYATVAYSRTGVALWTNRYSGPFDSFDRARAIAVDNRGHVFVTGYSYGSGTNYNYATVAYSTAGMPLWTNRYNGPANGGGGARAIAVDHNGNVFVTGYSTGTGSGWDYATIAYSGAGVPLWTNRYNGPGNTNDQANAVTLDNSGNVFVTGYSSGGGSRYDYATIAYSGAGVALWTNRYNGPANGADEPALSSCLAIGRDGAVYVTGRSDGEYGEGNSIYDYTTIKYVWRPYLAIQPLTAGFSTVDLTLSGPANSSWSIQRAPTVTGPWTNLGLSLIGTNGLGTFPDANPPGNGGFYRTAQP